MPLFGFCFCPCKIVVKTVLHFSVHQTDKVCLNPECPEFSVSGCELPSFKINTSLHCRFCIKVLNIYFPTDLEIDSRGRFWDQNLSGCSAPTHLKFYQLNVLFCFFVFFHPPSAKQLLFIHHDLHSQFTFSSALPLFLLSILIFPFLYDNHTRIHCVQLEDNIQPENK